MHNAGYELPRIRLMRSWVNSALPWQTSNKKLHRHDDGDDQGTSPGFQGGSWAYPSRPRLVVAPGGDDGDDDVILGVSRQATGFRVAHRERLSQEPSDTVSDDPRASVSMISTAVEMRATSPPLTRCLQSSNRCLQYGGGSATLGGRVVVIRESINPGIDERLHKMTLI
jgi:hypothetical protein